MEVKENKSDLRFEQEDDAVWVFSGDSQQGTEISHLITSHIDDYNEDDLRLICHHAANEIDRLRAELANATPKVLDSPARVGGGVFREGVKWKTVIESAQRLYENSKDEIKPILSPSDLLKIATGELVLVPKDELTTTYYWEGSDYVVNCVSEYEMELEKGEIAELEKWEQTKSTKAFFANIYSDEDNFEIVEFDSIEAAQQAIQENKAMVEAQEQRHD